MVNADFKHRLQRFEAFGELVHRHIVKRIAFQMVHLEKDITISLNYFPGVLLEQISYTLNEIYEPSGRLFIMMRSRGKLAFHNVKSLKSRSCKCLTQFLEDVLFQALSLVVEHCGETVSITFEEHVMETTSAVFV